MEITKKMNVPADFLYKTIIDSVLHDIKQATDQTLTEDQLEGYKQSRKTKPMRSKRRRKKIPSVYTIKLKR